MRVDTMKTRHETEITKLPVNSRSKPEMYGFLDEVGSLIHDVLIDALDPKYGIEKEAEVDSDDGEYNCTIKARSGMRVGAQVDIEWEVGSRHATIEVGTFTRFDKISLVTILFLGVASAVLAKFMEIPPFDLIPSVKIGFGIIPSVEAGLLLAAIAGFIFGLIVFLVLRPIVMAGSRRENDDLTKQVRQVVSRLNYIAEQTTEAVRQVKSR